ncbi:phosphoesterase [Weissella oryzae SG25]|uniref:Phosphoesterase n=1 Tax=Weissella oryzae (strain DSM 25784 / JCM 18191 / LMG 30913 / SG25) TaxID=1329250 RepID=A0A069CUW0_WEIOS|nr:YfcE family phosphodiesterase [Weissella oryzae]GAK31259.1 phosphoesterase [Weissella oryzae SG25]
MDQYLIISDTHGDRKILTELFDHYKGQVKAIFYNGDSELAANDSVFKDVWTVIGNMDNDANFPDEHHYQDGLINLYQTHGHLFGTERTLNQLRQKAADLAVDIVTSGHTHQLGAEVIDHRLFINPGSISLPKGTYAYLGGTYAILSVSTNQYTVTFYTRDAKPVDNLEFSFKRPL